MSSRLRAIARETVAITERGGYRTEYGEVTIGEQVTHAVAGAQGRCMFDRWAVELEIRGVPGVGRGARSG